MTVPCLAFDFGWGLANSADANFSLSTNLPVGMETGNAAVNSGSAIGTAAAGAMGTSQTAFMQDGFQLVLDLLNRGEIGDRLATAMSVKSGYSYFNATVGLLMLLTMTGAFQAW